MKLIIELSDLQQAPQDVQTWLMSVVTGGSSACCRPKVESKASESAPAPAPAPTNGTVSPTMDELLQRATNVLEAGGTEVLKSILAKVGISRVKECPPDKRATLLAEMAIHGK